MPTACALSPCTQTESIRVGSRVPSAVRMPPACTIARTRSAAASAATADGTLLPTRIDSVCVHGDSPHAVTMARAVRARL
ncbi:MAG: hypothetical protein EOO66_31125, partial [Methylobacterium sp.]